jgi:hypothetical protein|tara:strand:- start:6448 stop:6666 length:219 start_codon:yes stop_codon:yes gene_type:complete
MEQYTGTRFFIEVNDPNEGNGSVTTHVVYGTDCKRTNKRRLRKYLTACGEPVWNQKLVLKAMGFWGEGLGRI